jgi:hypothetical protein
LDAPRRFFRTFEGHVNAKRLMLAIRALSVTNGYLLDVAVLAEELGLS